MSQYATAAELAATPGAGAYVSELTTDEKNTALERASGMMDGYFAARFSLPLASYGGDVTQCCCHIAAWLLASGRGFDTGAAGNTAKQWFDWWMKWLADVAAGTVPTTIVEADTSTPSGARVSTTEARGW